MDEIGLFIWRAGQEASRATNLLYKTEYRGKRGAPGLQMHFRPVDYPVQ